MTRKKNVYDLDIPLTQQENFVAFAGHQKACTSDIRIRFLRPIVRIEYRIQLIIRPSFLKGQILLCCSIGSQVDAEHVISRLWIAGASNQDSGNYSCHLPGHMPEEFPRAIVKVLVVDGRRLFRARRSVHFLWRTCHCL